MRAYIQLLHVVTFKRSYLLLLLMAARQLVPVSVPIHEYWLEHKRANDLELAAQRDAMMNSVHETERSCLLGIDLLKEKLERESSELREAAAYVVSELRKREILAWQKIQRRERSLDTIQRDLDQKLVDHLDKLKEDEYRSAETEQALKYRKNELETWAAELHKEFLHREQELGAVSRQIDRDLALLYSSRRKDAQKFSRREQFCFASILFSENEIPRIVVNQAINLTFSVSPHETLVGMPCTLTYLDGRGGSVSGGVVSYVAKNGAITFEGTVFSGPAGSSHIALVSMPRVAAGIIEPLELPFHLMAPPDVRAAGCWQSNPLALTGRIRIANIASFGLLGTEAQITLQHSSGAQYTVKQLATETNEFPFVIPAEGLTWDDVFQGRVFLESSIPLTKYTNSFVHRFEVKVKNEAFPTFQFPAKDSTDCGILVDAIPVDHKDLVTEVSISETGAFLAVADVSGNVNIFSVLNEECSLIHQIQHKSFVSLLSWASGGSHIALMEPREGTVHVWSMNDLLQHAKVVPSSEHTAEVKLATGGSTAMQLVTEGGFSLIVVVRGVVQYIPPSGPTVDIVDSRAESTTVIAHSQIPRIGSVVFVGYETGGVAVLGLKNRQLLFSTTVPSKDTVKQFFVLPDRVLVATSSTVSVLQILPCWGLMTCSFRTPSPIASIAAPLKDLSAKAQVLVVHTDGNLCLLDVESGRMMAHSALQGATGVTSLAIRNTEESASLLVVACCSLHPLAWKVHVAPEAASSPGRATTETHFVRENTGTPTRRGIPRGRLQTQTLARELM